MEALADEQHRAGDQGGEEGGEPEARLRRLVRPPPRQIEPEGAEQIFGQDQVEHRHRPHPLVGPGRIVEEHVEPDQPRRGDGGQHGAGEPRQRRARPAGVLTVPGREQPAEHEQGLGDDGPLDQAARDEIFRAGEAEGLLEPDVERGDGEQAGDRRHGLARADPQRRQGEAKPDQQQRRQRERPDGVERGRQVGRQRRLADQRQRARPRTAPAPSRRRARRAIAAATVATIPSARSSSRRAANATAMATTSQPAAIRSAGRRSQAAAPASSAAVAPASEQAELARAPPSRPGRGSARRSAAGPAASASIRPPQAGRSSSSGCAARTISAGPASPAQAIAVHRVRSRHSASAMPPRPKMTVIPAAAYGDPRVLARSPWRAAAAAPGPGRAAAPARYSRRKAARIMLAAASSP